MNDPLDVYNPPPLKSWWGRNWIWIVPLGCLTPLVLIGGCFVAVTVGIFSMLKSTEAYTGTLAAVRADPRVQAALGEPIEPSFLMQGNVHMSSNDGGNANLTFSVSGPKGSATVHVVGTKARGVWTYQTRTVQLPNGETVDLTTAGPAELPPK